MKIAIDMQGALSIGSRPRGIGRYTLNLVQAMARLRSGDLHLMLNDNFNVSADETAAEMQALDPTITISRFRVPTLTDDHRPLRDVRRQIGQDIVRRAFACSRADVMFATSIFEIKASDFFPARLDTYPAKLTVAILYDLIPLIYENIYLEDKEMKRAYMESVEALRHVDLLLAISDSAKEDGIRYANLDPSRIVSISGAADAGFRPISVSDAERFSVMDRIGLSRDFIMYVAGADWRKNLSGAISALAAVPEPNRLRLQLLLVTNPDEHLRRELVNAARVAGLSDEALVIAPNVTESDLKFLLNMAEALVFPSLYEGFGLPVLEAMQCGTPVVVAKTSSLPEIVNRADLLYDVNRPEDAGMILNRLLDDNVYRADVSRWGVERAEWFSWEKTAARALQAIEEAGEKKPANVRHAARNRLLDLDGARLDIATMLRNYPAEDGYVASFVSDLLFSVPSFQGGTRRLLIDASVCAQTDAWTGIQRVVRKLTAAFYQGGAERLDVIPVAVRLYPDRIDTAANHIALALGEEKGFKPHEIDVRRGDDLFMLDSNWIEFPNFVALYNQIRNLGGKVYTCVYDLIPEYHPEVCDSAMPIHHLRWLTSAVLHSDGLICISKSVAHELISFIQENKLSHRPNLKVGWFHCGSNLNNFHSTRLVREHVREAFATETPTFLAVGTLEPRKRHALALDAFEILWKRGVDVTLVFIGAEGWKIEALAERLRSHPEYDRRLFWFQHSSDNDVSHAYENASAVVSMSMAEGFGLPLAESARLGKGVICSDIPVFREVGGEGAVYFKSEHPGSMAEAVEDWLAGRRKTDPSKVSRTTWAEAARRIGDVIYGGDWLLELP